jgi:hypothetical protein
VAISNWILIGIALAATLVICGCARVLGGGSRRIFVITCLVAGLSVTPLVIFAGFRFAGGIVGVHSSPIWYLVAWIVAVAISLIFVIAHARSGRSDPGPAGR